MRLAKIKTNSCYQFKTRFIARAVVFAFSLHVLVSCAPEQKQWKPESERRAFVVAPRQLAPEPVYNRLRWVHLPDVLPSKNIAVSTAPAILPVIHLDLKNSTLDQAVAALAQAARYSSFCSSSIANRRISVSKLGTIDELASEIEKLANIRVQVDHQGRALRFFPKPITAPEFLATRDMPAVAEVADKEVLKDEHKSNN